MRHTNKMETFAFPVTATLVTATLVTATLVTAVLNPVNQNRIKNEENIKYINRYTFNNTCISVNQTYKDGKTAKKTDY